MGLFASKRHKAGGGARLIAGLDGKPVKYVTRRGLDENGSPVETVIGKQGRINTRNGRIVIVCDGAEVFRCTVETAQCGELMSLNGVVISGRDETDPAGQETTVVAYYLYYR